MKILLDECVDARLAREITGHDVRTVPQMGWAGVKNGILLGLAQASFDVLVTTDGNLEYQQNLANFNLAVVILKAKTSRLVDLKPLMPRLLAMLSTAARGKATKVTE